MRKQNKEEVFTEIINGNGNNMEEAKNIADNRFNTWYKNAKKSGYTIEIIDKKESEVKKSAVHARHVIEITYKYIPKEK